MAEGVPYEIADLIDVRLKASLSVPVLQADSIERLPKNTPTAVVILPSGIEPDEQRRNQVALQEQVVVVVQTRNASTQLAGSASRQDAGPLLTAVIKALLGWTPDDAKYEPLVMLSAPGPEHDGGIGYYPLAFATRYVVTGE